MPVSDVRCECSGGALSKERSIKRFLLFIFDVDDDGLSRSNGWLYFEEDFDSIEEARAWVLETRDMPLKEGHITWGCHIADTITKKTVEHLDDAIAAGHIPVDSEEDDSDNKFHGLPDHVPAGNHHAVYEDELLTLSEYEAKKRKLFIAFLDEPMAVRTPPPTSGCDPGSDP